MTAPDRGAHTKSPLLRRGRPHITLGTCSGGSARGGKWSFASTLGGGLRRFPTFGWSWHELGGPQHRCFWNKGHQVAGKSHQPGRVEPYLCLGPLPARRAPSYRRGRVMRVRTGLDVLEYELRQEQA